MMRSSGLNSSAGKVTPLQRLFSMFPDGWPGRGLLLLRLAAGAVLLHDGIAALTDPAPHKTPALLMLAGFAGIFLILGLWTPVTGALSSILELVILLAGADQLRSGILLIVIGISIATLGPGVWSVDAVLFGRHRLDLPDR
jgi:putative oxidoreductase